mmetsp:Transcript_12386/g.40785  ORF Transcript_12386/g.40785 Transcript_12386/m.40785 type:complete len:283 (+) Transcript_12386:296-1144(+)|eukprot:CAMPEP_0170161702 /NCGR_PEP_ID=MMETSP0033_2-20121228/76722_1 /TAXON_ID=195969 /ORGANISM="Dolichomastix tenuilepis, Strain CCMP3274" /LENGTH=282 /DNA_ID=CAMNT_0010399317 /DNA_START=197 /DNA_END=1045 /DNA_ORIENTATION=-
MCNRLPPTIHTPLHERTDALLNLPRAPAVLLMKHLLVAIVAVATIAGAAAQASPAEFAREQMEQRHAQDVRREHDLEAFASAREERERGQAREAAFGRDACVEQLKPKCEAEAAAVRAAQDEAGDLTTPAAADAKLEEVRAACLQKVETKCAVGKGGAAGACVKKFKQGCSEKLAAAKKAALAGEITPEQLKMKLAAIEKGCDAVIIKKECGKEECVEKVKESCSLKLKMLKEAVKEGKISEEEAEKKAKKIEGICAKVVKSKCAKEVVLPDQPASSHASDI